MRHSSEELVSCYWQGNGYNIGVDDLGEGLKDILCSLGLTNFNFTDICGKGRVNDRDIVWKCIHYFPNLFYLAGRIILDETLWTFQCVA